MKVRQIALGLEMPEEVTRGLPLITMRGKEVAVIENYKRLIAFGNSEISLIAGKGGIYIRGSGLGLEYMRSDSIKITGEISEISFW